jgi:hypothetical protein
MSNELTVAPSPRSLRTPAFHLAAGVCATRDWREFLAGLPAFVTGFPYTTVGMKPVWKVEQPVLERVAGELRVAGQPKLVQYAMSFRLLPCAMSRST